MLKSRNVFVDTQAFHQHKFRFDHPSLKRLLELCSSGAMQLVLTETVLGEVQAHIKQQLAEASKLLSQFQNNIGLLEGKLPNQYQGFTNKPHDGELADLAINLWKTYLAEAKVIIAPANVINVSELMECYFESKPPFGEGRKKNEFPDAISMLSLSAWIQTNKNGLYIVSQDNDLERWCEQSPEDVVYVKSLAEFISLYNRSEKKLTELVDKLLANYEARFLEAIKTEFLQLGFQYSDNWEAVVNDVEIIKTSIFEVNIIDVSDDEAQASLTVQIEFTADITGPDYDHGIWDSEDKTYAYVPQFNFQHSFSENYEVSVEFSFSSDVEEINHISVTFADGIDITLHIDDGYPYK